MLILLLQVKKFYSKKNDVIFYEKNKYEKYFKLSIF